MPPLFRTGPFPILLAIAACAVVGQEAICQDVTVRVVDGYSRNGIEGVAAVLLDTDSTEVVRALSGPDGFFHLSAPAPGTYLLQVSRLGFASQTRSLTLLGDDALIPAFVLQAEVFAMDTLAVEVDRGGATPRGAVGFSRPNHLLAGEGMATLERSGVSFASAATRLGGGLRSRNVTVGERSYNCIESARHVRAFERSAPCEMVAIVINGVGVQLNDDVHALQFVQSLQIYDYESVEYLSPVDAGFRYGLRASDRGALVLWTRNTGPHTSEARGGGNQQGEVLC